MPRLSQTWKTDPERCRYYRLRADRIEQENAERRENLISTKQIQSDLRAFAAAIQRKIVASALERNLKLEICDDLADLPHQLSVDGRNGNSNAKTRSTRRGRIRAKKHD
jgi:hypothetical protein